MKERDTRLTAAGVRGIIREFSAVPAGGALLFTSAGTLHWDRGWIYLSLAAAYQAAYVILLLKTNPALLNERGTLKWKETRRYDRYFIVFHVLCYCVALVVGGLDSVRFGWSHAPGAALTPGVLMFLFSSLITLWAYRANARFLLTLRKDAGVCGEVCTTGPYRYIRHPGYLGAIIAASSFPLITGSMYSMVPVFFIIANIIVRTHFEDSALTCELEGYCTYAERTPYRLVPYLW